MEPLTSRWIVVVIALASFITASASGVQEIRIINAERRIDLTSSIVRVYLTLKVENVGEVGESKILLAFPPAVADHIAVVKAQAAQGKKKQKTYTQLNVEPEESPEGPNGAKYFAIFLSNPLKSGDTATIEVLYSLTHALKPFPPEISQSESQLVHYKDSAYVLSPYHIKKQATLLKTPSKKVESFTRIDPTTRSGMELTYGPYENLPPHSYSPVIVHFENNNPFAVVEELEREIEVSHWGSLQITERYRLSHGGARHKGVFSRVEYQSRSSGSASSFKNLLLKLPPRVHSAYYRDEIGNISSSHLRMGLKSTDLEFEPRYPLFGGWKTTFVIGYSLPLQDFLFLSPDGRRYLNFTYGCPLQGAVVDKLTVKVVLPEGSKNPSAIMPFPVEERVETKFSYLDVVGRIVMVLEKKNVVPDHSSPFQVYYSFDQVVMLLEPLMLVSVFFLLFLGFIFYFHTDLSLQKDT